MKVSEVEEARAFIAAHRTTTTDVQTCDADKVLQRDACSKEVRPMVDGVRLYRIRFSGAEVEAWLCGVHRAIAAALSGAEVEELVMPKRNAAKEVTAPLVLVG